jgi:hypothetical protein
MALLALLSFSAAVTAQGQLIKVPTPATARRPITLSVSSGFLQTEGRYDGPSETLWSLGEAAQHRLMVDVGLSSGALGLTASTARVPIVRQGVLVPTRSDGTIQLRQLLATFRTLEQMGPHQIVELGAGLSQWAGFRGADRATANANAARDALTLVVGYGFGFSLGTKASLTLVQDYATLWGPSEGLPAGERRTQRQYVTRIGLRYRVSGAR